MRPPGSSVYPVSRGGWLKTVEGKPVETGWRVLPVVSLTLKRRAMTRLRRGKPCEHGLCFSPLPTSTALPQRWVQERIDWARFLRLVR